MKRVWSVQERNDKTGADREGVSASVSLIKSNFKRGEPIAISFSIANYSSEEITLWLSGFWPNHSVIVRNDNGGEPKLTAVGQERRKAFQPSGPRRKNVPLVIKPGGVHQDDTKLDLSELYELGPGGYTLEITYDDRQQPTPLRVTSPAIKFEVQ